MSESCYWYVAVVILLHYLFLKYNYTLNYITTDITVIIYYDCITIFTTIIHYYITKHFSLCCYHICNGI